MDDTAANHLNKAPGSSSTSLAKEVYVSFHLLCFSSRVAHLLLFAPYHKVSSHSLTHRSTAAVLLAYHSGAALHHVEFMTSTTKIIEAPACLLASEVCLADRSREPQFPDAHRSRTWFSSPARSQRLHFQHKTLCKARSVLRR